MPNVRASTRTLSELGKWRELMRWLPLPILLLLWPPLAALAQTEGDLTVTDVDFFKVMTTQFAQQPLEGGGADLWAGGELIFPQEQPPQPSSGQVYRAVTAAVSAPLPECHDGTADVTVSVQVFNLGPQAGHGYSGALRLLEDGAPEDWLDRALDTAAAPTGGPPAVLTVSATVPAEDLAAGRVFVELDLETYDTQRYKSWRADQLQATYAFDTSSCVADVALEKSGSGPDPASAGDTVEYSFLVTNTGDFTLDNVTVLDPLTDLSPIDCPDDSLAPDASMTCTASYTLTQADIKAGLVENTATVTGDPSGGLDPVSDEDSVTVPLTQAPGIAIDKRGSGPDPLTVGATIDYTFLVANTGNVTLSNVTVTDPLPDLSPISCPDDTLAPDAEMTCTATYTVTQEDADAGIVQNTATASGDPPSGPAVSDDDFAVVPPSQKPGISLEKTGSGPDPLTVGATVNYSFVVTNTGNVSLSNVTVTDSLPGLSPISCPDDTLAPGAEMTCNATYEVTQEDVNVGAIENTATATGQAPGDLPSPTDESSTTVPPTQASGISIEKSGSGPDPLTVGATGRAGAGAAAIRRRPAGDGALGTRHEVPATRSRVSVRPGIDDARPTIRRL